MNIAAIIPTFEPESRLVLVDVHSRCPIAAIIVVNDGSESRYDHFSTALLGSLQVPVLLRKSGPPEDSVRSRE